MKMTWPRLNIFIVYLLFIFIGWISINLSHGPVGLENRAYLANVISIVEDHDFNIINNVPAESRWIVSRTYNFPDMHFDGLTVFHVVNTLIAKTLKPFFPAQIKYGLGEDSIYLFAICVSTISFFFIALMLLHRLFYQTQDRYSNFIMGAFLFSTPVLYWTFSDYSSSDSLCFFASALMLYFMLTTEMKNKADYFVLGSLLGLGLVLKPSYFFYVPLFFIFAMNHRPKWRQVLFFLAPVAVFMGCRYLNNYLRFGYLTYFSGYEYAFYFDAHLLMTSLQNYVFGVFGLIHQAPWLMIVLFLFITRPRTPFKNPLLIGISIALIAKIFYEILCLTSAETEFGFRRFVIDVPFLLYFLSIVIKDSPTMVKKCLAVFFALTSLYMIIYWPWYRSIDSLVPSPMGIYKLWEYYPVNFSLSSWFVFWRRFNLINYSMAFAIIWIFVTTNYLLFLGLRNRPTFRNVSLALLAAYCSLTAINFTNNRNNTEVLREKNFFAHMVVSNNKNAFLYDEFFSEIGRDLLIAKYKHDLSSFNFSKNLAFSFIDSLNEGLIVDPIHFKEINLNHQVRPIYYLNDAINTDAIFNFNSKTKFNEVLNQQR